MRFDKILQLFYMCSKFFDKLVNLDFYLEILLFFGLQDIHFQNLPNLYTISAHPDLIWEWQDDAGLFEKLKRVINIISTESAMKFAAPLAPY